MKSSISKESLREAYITTIDLGVREKTEFNHYFKIMNQTLEQINELGRKPDFLRLLEFANALANEIRLKILHYIYKNGKTCFCELENLFGVKKSTLNYHVKMMVRAGLLKSSKSGKLVILELSDDFPTLIPSVFMSSFEGMN